MGVKSGVKFYAHSNFLSVYIPKNSRNLRVCSSIGDNRNYCYTYNSLTLDEWTHISVSQRKDENDVYRFSLKISDNEVLNIENTNPLAFENVAGFVANNWGNTPPADGCWKNLNLTQYGDYEFSTTTPPTTTQPTTTTTLPDEFSCGPRLQFYGFAEQPDY